MKKIIVEVSYTGNHYGAHIPLLPGCITTGNSLSELEGNMKDAIRGHLEVSKEFGDVIPNEFEGEYELEYHLSVEALINHYSSIFTKAALSRITGINERQLWHYAAGVRKPRPAQRKRIEEGLHNLGKELMSLSLD